MDAADSWATRPQGSRTPSQSATNGSRRGGQLDPSKPRLDHDLDRAGLGRTRAATRSDWALPPTGAEEVDFESAAYSLPRRLCDPRILVARLSAAGRVSPALGVVR
jgi:hypothetical protein